MVKIYNYTGGFPTMRSTSAVPEVLKEYRKNRFSLFDVMPLYAKNTLADDDGDKEWSTTPTKVTDGDKPRECMVFYSWDSMRFFAMNRFVAFDMFDANAGNDSDRPNYDGYFYLFRLELDRRGIRVPKYIEIGDALIQQNVGINSGRRMDELLERDVIDAKDLDDMLKNRKSAFDKYNKDEFRTKLTDFYLSELNKFLVDVAEKLNNFETMTRAFNSSDVNMVLSPSAMEPFKWAELPSTNYSNPGTLGFSGKKMNKMTGGDISAEVLSLVHLLEYRNAVNNNFVNNVLPTLKGGARPVLNPLNQAVDAKTPGVRDLALTPEPENIERELVNYITNTQTDLTLYNRLTEFARDPSTADEMRSYLNRLARDVAKAEGIRRLIEADRSLLGENTWDKIREKVGKYGTRAATVGNKLKQAIHIILGANSVTVT